MDFDLSTALHDAARAGTASRPDLASSRVMQRIRRRRRVRAVGESTVGVAAAGAVAFGAVQVLDGRGPRPAPPATSAPTPTPSPADDVPWRVHGTTRDFACGLPVPEVTDPPGDGDLHLEAVLGAATVTAGDRLTIDAELVNGTGQDLDATTTADGVRVWLARSGTVVGAWSPSPVVGPDVPLSGGPGDRWPRAVAGVPVACGPGDEPTAPVALPAGTYDVFVTEALRLDDGGTLRVVGGPLPLVIDAPAEVLLAPPTPSSTPEPEGPPDPPADARPDPEDLVISPAGLGPLAVGAPPRSNAGAAMVEWDPDHCTEAADGSPGRWVASGYAPEVRDGEPRPLFHVAADDEQVGRIDVLSSTIRTAEGVGVGTTVTDLQAAYPGLAGPFQGPVSRVWWLTGPAGTLVFETQGAESGLQPAGTPESVVIMRVLAAGSDPAFATANSDDIAGGCW